MPVQGQKQANSPRHGPKNANFQLYRQNLGLKSLFHTSWMCVVGIRRNSTSMRGSRSHLYRLLSALRHLRTPILGCILVRKKNSHFASVFCLYLRRFRRGFGLFPSYMTLRSARVWFLVLFRHFKFSSKSLRRPYAQCNLRQPHRSPAYSSIVGLGAPAPGTLP